MSCVDDYECAICTSMRTVNLSAHAGLAVVEIKIE